MKYLMICDLGGRELFIQSEDGSRTVPLERRNRAYQQIEKEIGIVNLERVKRKI